MSLSGAAAVIFSTCAVKLLFAPSAFAGFIWGRTLSESLAGCTIKMIKTESTSVLRWTSGARTLRQTDEVAVEEPLEIQVDTRSVCVTMRTPGEDEELAAGFLLTEGLIGRRQDILKIQPYPRNPLGNVLNVFL